MTAWPLLAALAEGGREAGTARAREARARVAAHLATLGWLVEEDPVRFSAASPRALPIAGAVLGWLTLLLAPLLAMATVPRWGALAVWGIGVAGGALLVGAVALGWTALGDAPREDATLVARRPGGVPTRWLVAHLDSIARRSSLAGAAVATGLLATATLVLGGLAALRLAGAVAPAVVAAASLLAIAASALAARGGVQGESAGARDNLSGLAALLAAAERAGPETGLVIPAADEFGAVGARLLARRRPAWFRGTTVLVLDTIDGEGAFLLQHHDAAGRRLADDLARRLVPLGAPVRLPRVPPGVLRASAPFALAGARALTLSRLTWHTARIIHTPRDTPAGFSFEPAERLGAVLAAD